MPRTTVPSIPTPQTMDRDAEIDQIKRELDVLRADYARYSRAGKILKIFSLIILTLFAIGLSVLAFELFASDTKSSILFFAVLIIFVPLILSLFKKSDFRWIDFASSTGSHSFLDSSFYQRTTARSGAELIEEQIASRERRLSELGEIAQHQ
jgi:hypothetical protein